MNWYVSSKELFFRRPIIMIVVIGLLIRFILMPLLTYDFDIYHWGLIISNINSGNNLYDLDGYYYTPTWGYLLGFISTVQQFLVDIGPMGIRFTDMLPIENLEYPYHIATITSLSFNVCMKIPLVLCDIAVGYLIYLYIKERTENSKKATYGFALWFLCPIVIYMSSVQAMFDTFSALLLLLVVIMFQKSRYFLGGTFFSMAVLLKFFPGFCIFVLLAYIIVKHRGDGLVKAKMIRAALGAGVMSIVLMFPLIVNGQVADAFYFLFGRVDDVSGTIFIIFNALIAIFIAVFFGYVMYRSSPEKADDNLSMCVMFSMAASTLMSITPQYIIVVIPFLIIYAIISDRRYIKCLILISVSAFLGAFLLNNLSLLASLSEYNGMVSSNWILNGMQFLETGTGINIISSLTRIVNSIQYISIFLLILFYFAESLNERIPILGRIILFLKGEEVEADEA